MNGIHVPLVTPFAANGEVDAASLERLARHCLEEGAAGLVALGTTGESAMLTAREREAVLEVCRRVSDDHGTPLTVGVSGMGTATTVEQAREHDRWADRLMVVVPYYLRPTDEGVMTHFEAVVDAVRAPVIVYNVPHRTGKALTTGTLATLLSMEGVGAVKHCAGAIDQGTLELLALDVDADVLTGDDALIHPMLGLGAAGAISTTANIAPGHYRRLHDLVRGQDTAAALELHNALLPLVSTVFAEPNPTVVKAALSEIGLIDEPTVRAPLCQADPQLVSDAVAVFKELP
ncbi:4-hydroxy-tetrahydrodipicolinate synthase [Nocardiopsis sp. EMB25]|uniref:4-hydroxy-tetrahydrodipicolinate synthase n=1 Tax=Nocardiopsis sp. EMB25 TaxID=2835867 RepID=UPI0022840C26|nr:4-hydroxy-tetrahydrodipicolinate synthase [Nocardiopsis sp. EMB25]MCY9786118.1 4-hydroxy-tetrahydrodipicolinate synthase [Nocardiopsis sp. EMB25]